MAFSVGDKVVVSDDSTQYRGRLGQVMAYDSVHKVYDVRLCQFGKEQHVPLREEQMRADTRNCPIDYSA